MEKKSKKELEQEISGLNFLLLEQKDTINALGAERDKWKFMAETLAKIIGDSERQANVSGNGGFVVATSIPQLNEATTKTEMAVCPTCNGKGMLSTRGCGKIEWRCPKCGGTGQTDR